MFHELVVYRFVLSVVYRLISVYHFFNVYTQTDLWLVCIGLCIYLIFRTHLAVTKRFNMSAPTH